MIRSSHHGPVYREVLSHAIKTAWQEKRFWPIAILAGLLVTAGSYDVMWNAVTGIAAQGPFLAVSTGSALLQGISDQSAAGANWVLGVVGGIEMLVLIAIVILFFAGISCLSQGALIHAIGARRRGTASKLGEAFRVASQAFWPILVLNAMVFALIWVLRFLVAFPLYLALDLTTTTTYLLYLVSFVVFVPLAFFIAIVEIFALNAMILQGANLADAIRRGYLVFKRNWVIVIETALLQAAISVAVWLLFLASLAFVMIPVFAFVVTSAMIQSVGLFTFSLILGVVIFLVMLLVAAAFTIVLQYATWSYMYRKLGEGGVVPKIHRMVHNATRFLMRK